jgi:2-oxoglutarate dehydrogenase E2 component (dihydrolipoamide succinyltransferase)
MAVIQTDGDTPEVESAAPAFEEVVEKEMAIEFEPVAVEESQDTPPVEVPTYALQDPSPEFEKNPEPFPASSNANEFYSPLVKSIARAEQISAAELKQIKGTGKNNRITKKRCSLIFGAEKRSSVKASSPPTGGLSKA